MLASHQEEPDRGYGWVRKPDAPVMRIVSGCDVENAPTHPPQHMTMEKVATGS
ncbi:hypothetical protein [Pontibacter pamirensis]|uniref:hypothetical protein n=1 Tax=Pontibacter pamirensis TaxID=2562824 RepID=UPI00138A3BAF|nr:hypothetical protein [Pontibacter pamirensis]